MLNRLHKCALSCIINKVRLTTEDIDCCAILNESINAGITLKTNYFIFT